MTAHSERRRDASGEGTGRHLRRTISDLRLDGIRLDGDMAAFVDIVDCGSIPVVRCWAGTIWSLRQSRHWWHTLGELTRPLFSKASYVAGGG